ncbi:MAG: hypothetical protein GX066_08575 [Clostridiaceae bacterium]|nr:hypothetical protein [Clostridiaceae bacterium]
MKENNNSEQQLKELCIILINILNSMKKEGIIDEQQYLKHTKLKKKFIEYLDKLEMLQ